MVKIKKILQVFPRIAAIVLAVMYVTVGVIAWFMFGSDPEAEVPVPCVYPGLSVTMERDMTYWKEPFYRTNYMGENYEYRAAFYPEGAVLTIIDENAFNTSFACSWRSGRPHLRRWWVGQPVNSLEASMGENFISTEERSGCIKLLKVARLYRDYIRQNGLEDDFFASTGRHIGLCSSVDAVLSSGWQEFLRGYYKPDLSFIPYPVLPHYYMEQVLTFVTIFVLMIAAMIARYCVKLHEYNVQLKQKALENAQEWERKFRRGEDKNEKS